MERLVRHLTKQFVNKLPDNQKYFTAEELYDLDIPDYVVDRVVMEMKLNLSESIVPPHSEWANMKASRVQEAWGRFLRAIVAEVRMPAAHVKSVFETATGDVLDMILQPRTSLPQIIFGGEKTLTREQLADRVEFVTINKHLTIALMRYMERKQKEELTLKDCEYLVEKIDERLTKDYNPLNWAQILEPLFTLLGSSVDSNLFRIFFEDKGMQQTARRFDYLNSSLNKTKLIEELSSPTIADDEDEDPSTIFDVPEQDKTLGSEVEDAESEPAGFDLKLDKPEPEPEQDLSEVKGEQKKEESKAETPDKPAEEDEDGDPIIKSFQKNRVGFNPDGEEEDKPLHSIFSFDDSEEIEEEPQDTLSKQFEMIAAEFEEVEDPEPESEPESEKDISSSRDEKAETEEKKEAVDDSIEEETESESPRLFDEDMFSETDIPETEEEPKEVNWVAEESDEDEELDEDEAPMWKAFLGDDEQETDEEKDPAAKEEEHENVDEDGFIDEPIIDLTKESSENIEQSEQIAAWLEDDRERFVDEIFGESDSAFEQALIDITRHESWKEASKYIEKEIFARNLVDMYDEAAVDFTDRLHTFFMEYKSDKKHNA